tara:strand:- start:1251 stop:1631 length:381 start_codon:yes stop_codon:yes gene_type:complete
MDLLERIYRILQANLNAGSAMSYADIEEWLRKSGYGGNFNGYESESDGSTVAHSVPLNAELAGYYANLEISYGSDLETSRRAWKSLLKRYHPDLHAKDPAKRELAHQLTVQLTKAYQEIERHLNTQ